jgi:nucleotide-binding universal stress UspA family protein
MAANPIRRLLVPTDLSDFGRVALRWADCFRDRLGAQITLMFANEPYFPVDVLEMAASPALLNTPELHERLNSELRDYAAANFADTSSIDMLVVDDYAATAIVQTAKKLDADLILMGTHGRRGLRRIIVGSVTENVLHLTDRPLMSVPPSDAKALEPQIRKIICPVNFTNIARQALERASTLAETFGAELILMNVEERSAPADFDQWIQQSMPQRREYTKLVVHGHAAEEVLKTADSADADLIVIGAQHKRFRDATVIGTTTERVVRFAKRPVLTVIGY